MKRDDESDLVIHHMKVVVWEESSQEIMNNEGFPFAVLHR